MISWSILVVCCIYSREILNILIQIDSSALYRDWSTNPIDFKSRNEQRLFWGIRDKWTAVLCGYRGNGLRRLSLRVALDSIAAQTERSHLFPACRVDHLFGVVLNNTGPWEQKVRVVVKLTAANCLEQFLTGVIEGCWSHFYYYLMHNRFIYT